MNSAQLYKQAKAKADQLPKIVRTPLMIQSVMMADVSQWISNQHYGTDSPSDYFDGEMALAILKTANEAIDMIQDYMHKEIL